MSEIKWHSGPPPHGGWWHTFNPMTLYAWRWWNGDHWSTGAFHKDSAKAAGNVARIPTALTGIQWCDYWPENARVPRVDPR